MAGKPSPVEIVLKGVDKVTGPIAKINAKLTRLQRPARDLQGAFSKVGASAARLAFQVGAVGTALGFAAVNGMRKFVNEADALEEAATAAGVSIEALQELRYAASFGGVDEGTLDSALQKFSVGLGKAKAGMGGFATSLGKTAPALLKQMKAASSTGEALDLFLDAAERAKDPSLRNALLNAGFGRGGVALAPMLEGLKEARRDAHETNNVLSIETVRAAAKTADEFERAGKRAKGLSNVFFAELLPNVLELVKRFNKWTIANRELVATRVAEFARNISDGVSWLADNLPGAVKWVQEMVEWCGGWKTVLIGLAAVKLGPLIGSLWGLAAALAVNPIGQIVLALAAIATTITLIVQNWDTLMAKFDAIPTWVRDLATGGFAGIVPGVGPAVNAGTSLLDLTRGALGQGRLAESPTAHVVIEDTRGSLKVKEVRASGIDLSWLTGPTMSDG